MRLRSAPMASLTTLALSGAKEDDVAIDRAGARQDRVERIVMDVLDDGRLQAFTALAGVIDLDVGQTLGAIDADELGVGIDLGAADLGAARRTRKRHHPTTVHVGGSGRTP